MTEFTSLLRVRCDPPAAEFLEWTQDRVHLSRRSTCERAGLRGVPLARVDILVDGRCGDPDPNSSTVLEFGVKVGHHSGAQRDRWCWRSVEHTASAYQGLPWAQVEVEVEAGGSTRVLLRGGDGAVLIERAYPRLNWVFTRSASFFGPSSPRRRMTWRRWPPPSPSPNELNPGETMTRTIRLTDGPPVRIDDDEWPSVAWASDEVDHTPKAKRSGWVRVRRHADGRHIVYSGSRSTNPREGNLEAGWVVPAADRRRLDQYIEAAAEAIGWPTLAASCSKSLLNRLITEAEEALFATLDADCIADLPPAEDDEDDDG